MAEYTIDKFTYDGNTYKLKSSTLKNLVDGSQAGSVRGTNTIAEGSGYTIGYSAFVEGVGTRASGDVSHAEGKGTNATGQYSHAEGYYNTASGLAAHAEGNQTTANHAYQHVFGSYNVADNSTATATNKGNYIEIVGKGTSNNARSNARTLDWSGNETLSGKLTLGAVGVNSMDAATVGQIPNVPAWALESTKPTYTAVEVGAQPTLVSGTNIKTINSESILGSGDITIQGESYTATSPIAIDENNDISHETSGVTAGTYDGGYVKSTGVYFPKFTVDEEGHITAATDLGTLLPSIHGSNYSAQSGFGLVDYGYYSRTLREYEIGESYILSAGQTTKTITISDDGSSAYSFRNYFRVMDLYAVNKSTNSPVLVDWTTSTRSSGGGSITITVSIAEAYTADIVLVPILSACHATM